MPHTASLHELVSRLATVEGHLAAVERMVRADRSCADVLRQTYAIRRALVEIERSLLEEHLQRVGVHAALEAGSIGPWLGSQAHTTTVHRRTTCRRPAQRKGLRR